MKNKDIGRLSRYLRIITKLQGRQKYVPTEELIDYVRNEMDNRNYNKDYNIRALQRDIQAIDDIFAVEIKNRRNYGYFINEEYDDPPYDYHTLLLNFDLLTSISDDSRISEYIIAEHHRPRGSENMSPLISAIKKSQVITFDYYLVREGITKSYTIRPHFLKESLGLWYLLGKNAKDHLIIFGIDRITNLRLTGETFRRDTTINPAELFRNSYGIWDSAENPVEHIVLSYSKLDGSFLKATPLHSSQTILVDTDEEFRISVDVRITNDFVMALLARSASLTVISPLHLRERIATTCREAFERNK